MESKNKQPTPLSLPHKNNALKANLRSKPRKRVKNKDEASLSKIVSSLGKARISYLDSPCGTIECVNTANPTADNQIKFDHSNPVPLTSTSFLGSKNIRCVKPKKSQMQSQEKRSKNQFSISSPRNSLLKMACASNFQNSEISLKQFGSSIQSSNDYFSIVSNPSSSGEPQNKRCKKPRKRKINKQTAERNIKLSTSVPQKSIVKMNYSSSANNSGNMILKTLCSDSNKSNYRDLSLFESLMSSGSELKESAIKEANTKEKGSIGKSEHPGYIKSSKHSTRSIKSPSLPSNSQESRGRILNGPSNSPVCSITNNSNGTNSVANFYEVGCSKFVVLMKPGSSIAVIGTVEIQLLKGSIEVLGYSADKEDEKLMIFSLQGSSHLSLKAKDTPQCEKECNKLLHEKLIALGLPEQLSHRVSKKSENGVLFTVTRNKTHVSSTVWPKFFENHSSFFIFPNTHLLNSGSRPGHIVERRIKCLFETNLQELGLKEFNEVSEWSAVENDIIGQDYPKVILCGGKSVGKSSLLRYLVNKCLFKWNLILVLDFDLGQCEFTVPGCISATLVENPLLGPNYTHLKEPNRSVFLGEVDVNKCPENYIGGCKSLIDFAKLKHGDVPWLINTMGFTKGLGVSLACGIINYVSPTHIIQIQSKDRKLNFPSLLEPKYVNCLKHSAFDVADNTMDYQLHVVPSGSDQPGFVSKSRGISPAESRNLVILSYMSRMLDSNKSCLSQVTPYVVSMEQLDLQTTNRYNLTKSQLAAAMNGNMVALCSKDSSNQFLDCRGFGIVRAVDFQKGTIFLITPLSLTELSRVNCLVKGNVGLPDSLYYNQGELVKGHVPYLSLTSGGSTARFAKRDFRSLPVTQKHNRQH